LARTVLLADDSVTAQNMGRRILMDAGYEVITVNNGSAALKKIHESHPDLIVLDVYMPGYGGLEVCQRLKEAEDTARIPVLLSVGKMEPFKADEAKRVRADGHIVKPFEASELLAALTRLEDRIVPLAEAAGGKRGKSEKSEKSEKKSRSWHGGDPLAGAEEVPTERVAYLAEAKKRRAQVDVSSEEAAAPVQPVVTASADQPAAEIAVEMSPAPAANSEVAANTPTAEFAVQESAIPAENDGQDLAAPVEAQAAEAVAEIQAPSEAAALEIPAAEVPAAEVSVAHAEASVESAAVESAPEVAAEPVASLSEEPATATTSNPASTARWVAENVALSVEEASLALEAEMQQAQAGSTVAPSQAEIPAQAQAASSVEAVAQTPSTEKEIQSENSSGAAFAAAASASGQQSAVSSQAVSAAAGDAASVPEVEPAVPSEASAAWENWQHIRDSVMSPQKAAAIAESVAEMAQASLPAPESAAKEDLAAKQDSLPSESASAAPAEPTAEDNSINDIVDSVLADLKPRLMQEIAKKLAAKK
jgi:CheY-like chemotaxis protein